jgi:hypothetical protein
MSRYSAHGLTAQPSRPIPAVQHVRAHGVVTAPGAPSVAQPTGAHRPLRHDEVCTRAPASCGVAARQGGGDGDAPWWWVIDEVVEPGSDGSAHRWRTPVVRAWSASEEGEGRGWGEAQSMTKCTRRWSSSSEADGDDAPAQIWRGEGVLGGRAWMRGFGRSGGAS